MIADFERSEFMIAPCVWPATFKQEIVPILLPSVNSTITTPNTNTTTTPPPNREAAHHPVPIGPIIGGIAGGVALILCGLILTYLFIWKPRRAKKHTQVPSDPSHSIAPTELSITDFTLNKSELDSQQYGAQEMLDIREVERRQKHELAGPPAGQELDTHVPVGSELDSPWLYEMPAREPVGSEMASPVSERSTQISPLSPGEAPAGYFAEERGRSRRPRYSP